MTDARPTPWETFWFAVDSDGSRRRWLASIAAITLASCFCGYEWYALHWWAIARERAAAARADGLWIHYSGPGVGWEWLALTLACVVYGVWGWRRLGGWLVCVQVAVILPVCTTYLDYIPDSIAGVPFHSWPGAAQGGCIAGVLAALGVAWIERRTPTQPHTVRAMFAAMLFAAVMLGGVKLWVEWDYAPLLANYREHGPW
jgi:hypothetical protein